mgnify:CR=1 FL=1
MGGATASRDNSDGALLALLKRLIECDVRDLGLVFVWVRSRYRIMYMEAGRTKQPGRDLYKSTAYMSRHQAER